MVVGGGVGGASILCWLARLGWTDVVLCEGADLTSGSTFHSAGLVGQLRGSLSLSQLTFALAQGARRRGAEILTNTRVEEISVSRGRVTGVVTDRGAIESEVVVNTGGIYAREIAALAGVNVPVIPLAHESLITRPSALPVDLPAMRDPSLLVYVRGQSGGLERMFERG